MPEAAFKDFNDYYNRFLHHSPKTTVIEEDPFLTQEEKPGDQKPNGFNENFDAPNRFGTDEDSNWQQYLTPEWKNVSEPYVAHEKPGKENDSGWNINYDTENPGNSGWGNTARKVVQDPYAAASNVTRKGIDVLNNHKTYIIENPIEAVVSFAAGFGLRSICTAGATAVVMPVAAASMIPAAPLIATLGIGIGAGIVASTIIGGGINICRAWRSTDPKEENWARKAFFKGIGKRIRIGACFGAAGSLLVHVVSGHPDIGSAHSAPGLLTGNVPVNPGDHVTSVPTEQVHHVCNADHGGHGHHLKHTTNSHDGNPGAHVGPKIGCGEENVGSHSVHGHHAVHKHHVGHQNTCGEKNTGCHVGHKHHVDHQSTCAEKNTGCHVGRGNHVVHGHHGHGHKHHCGHHGKDGHQHAGRPTPKHAGTCSHHTCGG
jgi:hypothetical protein